ncbi:MAG: N-formylglutamate amidohydrolase [Phenylobacterium sp.]|nr:MAG: N-formylglutamate amidohydrolase [Phenylobacterium sp.]
MSKHAGDSADGSTRLLAGDETPPFVVWNPGATSPLVLLGDHAGREIPRALRDLGLPEAELTRHIGWDIGVAGLGARLAEALGATFIAQRYSRLVIDCNREPSRDDAICAVSDGTPAPGNQGLSAAARQARIDEVFQPYHDRIAAELYARAAAGLTTVPVALHSFTPAMGGVARPWRFGVLHEGSSAYSTAVLARLRAALGANLVGDNEPYRMDATDYTIGRHALLRGLDYLELEVRQDLLGDAAGQSEVAAFLAPILQGAVKLRPKPILGR